MQTGIQLSAAICFVFAAYIGAVYKVSPPRIKEETQELKGIAIGSLILGLSLAFMSLLVKK